jgi:membrane protease YdiL (CAAX protease family)
MDGSTARPGSRIASIAGLIVALGAGFVLPFLPGQAHQQITDVGQDTVVVAFEWIVAVVLLAIVHFWERLPLSSIGFRALSRRDSIAIGVAFAGMYVGLGIATALTHDTSVQINGATPAQIGAVPLVLRVVLFLTAGFCEELMFRAYAIERLALFTGKLWIGGVVAVVLFTLAHAPRYGFSVSLADVAIIATFLTALYLWTRNFWACAIMHAFIDFVGLVAVPVFTASGPH